METIEIDGKKFGLFCECNDNEQSGLDGCAKLSKYHCDECHMWKWYYPDRPLEEKPYAMIPGPDGKLFKAVFGEKIDVSDDGNDWYEYNFLGYNPTIINSVDTSNYRWRFARPVQPKRPEIAEGEVVYVRDRSYTNWKPRLFAGWDEDGRPQAWHTETSKLSWNYVKTKSGQVWPQEE